MGSKRGKEHRVGEQLYKFHHVAQVDGRVSRKLGKFTSRAVVSGKNGSAMIQSTFNLSLILYFSLDGERCCVSNTWFKLRHMGGTEFRKPLKHSIL